MKTVAVIFACSTAATAAMGCNGKSPANGARDPVIASAHVSESAASPSASLDAAPSPSAAPTPAEPGGSAQSIVRIRRLGPDGSVVSEWNRGPNDPPALTAGRLDVAPFQHASPDRWYYLVGDREYAFSVLLLANGENRPRAETQEATLSDGSKALESKVTLPLGDDGAFLEVIATPLATKPAGEIEGAIGLHVVATMDARGFSLLGIHCSPIAGAPSCSVAAEREIGPKKMLRAAFWTAYLEKANLLVSFNAFETGSSDARLLAAELVQKTFSVGPHAKIFQ